MKLIYSTAALLCTIATVLAQYNDSPTPPRPIIPGAIPVPISRPRFRTQQLQAPNRNFAPANIDSSPAPRVRRPGSAARLGRISQQQYDDSEIPVTRNTFIAADPTPASFPSAHAQEQPVFTGSNLSPRPVEEPTEDEEQLDDVDLEPNPTPPTPPPTPAIIHRPNISPAFQRSSVTPTPISFTSRPQSLQPAVLRPAKPAFRPERPISITPRPIIQEEEPLPKRKQQVRPTSTIEPQYSRQEHRSEYVARPQQVVKQPETQRYYGKEERNKKPVSQVIRKYREDNPDGSITWGFENDDGTYKEEMIGIDCMVRGKYGYVDPDGVRREYTYASGIPCDKTTEEPQDEGYIDYQNNKYVLPNGESVDLRSMIKNKARKPVANIYRNQ